MSGLNKAAAIRLPHVARGHLAGESFVSDSTVVTAFSRRRLCRGTTFLATKSASVVIRSCRASWSVLEAVFDYAGTRAVAGIIRKDYLLSSGCGVATACRYWFRSRHDESNSGPPHAFRLRCARRP